MATKFILLWISLIVFCHGLCYAQTVRSNIEVCISTEDYKEYHLDSLQIPGSYSLLYPFPIQIKQIIAIKNYTESTFNLELAQLSRWHSAYSSLFFYNLQVYVKSLSGIEDDILTKITSFPNGQISIPIPGPNCHIEILYDYQPDLYFSNASESWVYFQSQFQNWQSWYFTHPMMIIEKITYTHHDDCLFFGTWATKEGDNRFVVNQQSTEDDVLSFFLLSKRYYDHYTEKIDNITVDFHISKGISVDTVRLTNKIIERPGSRTTYDSAERMKNRLSYGIPKLREIFNINRPLKLSVVDGDLSVKDAKGNLYFWGNNVKCSDNHYFACFDLDLWWGHALMHEIVHSFNKVYPPESDSTSLFFREAITEYISVIVSYKNKEERDSVFEKKWDYYNQSSFDRTARSIFKFTATSVYLDGSGEGSSIVAYHKVPYIINQLAQNIGEEQFLDGLSYFYENCVNENEITLLNLKQSLCHFTAISEDMWNKFVLSL